MTQQGQTLVNVAHLAVVRTLGEGNIIFFFNILLKNSGSFGEVKLLVDKNDSNIAVAVKIIDLNKHKDQTDSVRREVNFFFFI